MIKTRITIPGASRLTIRRYPHGVSITCPVCEMTARYAYAGPPACVTTFLHRPDCTLKAEIDRLVEKAKQAGFAISE